MTSQVQPRPVRPGIDDHGGDIATVLVPEEDLTRRLAEMAAEISRDYAGRERSWSGCSRAR